MQPGTMPLLAVNIGLSRRSSAWTPASLASPWAWYKFNTGQTIVTGVSAWTDAWGDATKTLLQATTARQPLLQGNGTLLFDGSNDNLVTSGSLTLNQPWSVIVYGKTVTWVLDSTMAMSSGFADIRASAVSPNMSLYAGAVACETPGFTVGTYAMLAAVFNGASSQLSVNNNAPVTGNPGTAVGTAFRIGANAASLNMQLWEVIVTNAALSAGDIASAYAYGQAQGFCA